jgi:AraC-like DNA-binding protein
MTQTPMKLTDSPDLSPLGDVLSAVRLSGAVFLRAEYSDPWAIESPPAAEMTSLFGSLARRLILFHIVAEGQCWLRLGSGAYVRAAAGEVLVLPYGDRHVMGGADGVPPAHITALLPTPPWKQFPVIRHGGGGTATTIICGYLHCADPVFDPLVKALPPLFSVRPPPGPTATWVAASIQYALDASAARRPANVGVSVRLPELLFSEVLRLYLESSPVPRSGWLAALRDPVTGPALTELHADPARRWTVDELARYAACSRSTLTERFSRLLGRAPMQYLRDWRLQLAASLLRETRQAVSVIAHQVGYESEEAFNRAFRRAIGSPPAQWRQQTASR